MRLPLKLAFVVAALGAVGRSLSRRLPEGDEAPDVFSIAAVVGGRSARATVLRHRRVLACCGGVALDFPEARLEPVDARLPKGTQDIRRLVIAREMLLEHGDPVSRGAV